MTLADRTAIKYRGKMAKGYEAKRKKQQRWDIENKMVTTLLQRLPHGSTVLDCPVGTGRYLPDYDRLGLYPYGIDSSEEMLALAAKKGFTHVELENADARNLPWPDKSVDAVVSVRFLDLIDEAAMKKCMAEFMRVARHTIILTIRVGAKYVLKSNTATHDGEKFLRMIQRAGWKRMAALPIFKQGWHVVLLERTQRSKHR